MSGLRLVVCGAGSVGSKLVDSLARSCRDPQSPLRLARLTLLDRDRLEASNLARHVALPEDVGREKVELLAGRVAALVPDLEVEPIGGSLFEPEPLARLEEAVAHADLVVSCFDNPPALFRLGALTARHGVPLLAGEVISGGIGLWLLAANLSPDAPCMLCLARARGEEVVLEEEDAPAPEVDYADPASLVPAARIPADDWTCGVAACLLAGQVVEAARCGGLPTDTPPVRLLALQRVAEPPAVARFFQTPLQLSVVPGAVRQADCPVCAAPSAVSASQHEAALSWFAPAAEERP